jgi:hypothetical protein
MSVGFCGVCGVLWVLVTPNKYAYDILNFCCASCRIIFSLLQQYMKAVDEKVCANPKKPDKPDKKSDWRK